MYGRHSTVLALQAHHVDGLCHDVVLLNYDARRGHAHHLALIDPKGYQIIQVCVLDRGFALHVDIWTVEEILHQVVRCSVLLDIEVSVFGQLAVVSQVGVYLFVASLGVVVAASTGFAS